MKLGNNVICKYPSSQICRVLELKTNKNCASNAQKHFGYYFNQDFEGERAEKTTCGKGFLEQNFIVKVGVSVYFATKRSNRNFFLGNNHGYIYYLVPNTRKF